MHQKNHIFLYIGTYTHGESEGIYIGQMNSFTGQLELIGNTRSNNPSFLAIDQQNQYLYAVNEVSEFNGEKSGSVSAYKINQEARELSLINQQSSKGTAPCYLTIDRTGSFVLLSNYADGSVSTLPIEKDGKLGAAIDTYKHEGSSIHPERQQGPHAHSIVLDPNNQYAYAPDLGIDKIMIYRFNPRQGKLEPNDIPWVKVAGGSGPRHFTFHPNGKFAYLINELDASLIVFHHNSENGALEEFQRVLTLPDDFDGVNLCADIHVHPSGKFIYASNRGHDSIVIFSIDEKSGELIYIGHQSTKGKTPRNFAIDPTGNFLLVANQDSNNIITFKINKETGKLTYTGQTIEVPMPVCLKFLNQ